MVGPDKRRRHSRCGIRPTMMVPIVVVVALLLLLRAIDVCESAGLTWAHSLASPTGGGSAAIGGGGFAATSFLSGRRLLSGDSGKKDDKGRSAAAKKARPRLKAARDFFHQFVTGHVRRPTPRLLHHLLYWLTAADAVHSVFLNEYSSKAALWWRLFQIAGPSSSPSSGDRHHHNALVPSVYSRLFYFAKLRPRLLYAIGALLRALQLCSPLRRILDPAAGVGAGVNLCALLAGSRWVKPLVLGWATTKWLWTWLGARQVDRAYLPITLSIHEWEEKKKFLKKDKNSKGQRQSAEYDNDG